MSQDYLENAGFMTRAIHLAQEPDPTYGALATPIYQTSTFCFDTCEQGMETFAGEQSRYLYSRAANPTRKVLEEKMAALEGGAACIATGSGMGAVSSVLLGILKSGDHIIQCGCIYGCTQAVIHNLLPKYGIEFDYVKPNDLEGLKQAIKPNTKVIYLETPTNPTMDVTDISKVKEIAGDEITVVVDNTFAPPPIQTPLKSGADIVVHSVTKYLNGHGDVIAGLIIGKNEELVNQIHAEEVTKLTGAICSPFDSFLIIRGIQTLGLRVQRHCENALAVAEMLEENSKIAKVNYPALKSSPNYEICQKQMNGLGTGMVSFEIKDGTSGLSSFEAAKKLINLVEIPHIAVSLGDPASLIEHPASMTHHEMAQEEFDEAGITQGLVRLSCGLEDSKDLVADLASALEKL